MLQFENKSVNMFIVKFPEPFDIPEYVIYETQRPSLKTTNKGIVWNDISFKMYDPISPSTTRAIMEGLLKLRKLESQILNITLNILDPIGSMVEEWKITGEIKSIDFGKLNWASTEPLFVTVDINVNKCVLIV